ncbi:hypothetical protein BC567DRAFT_218037, partial [Phyllosticta citribraziliensis]
MPTLLKPTASPGGICDMPTHSCFARSLLAGAVSLCIIVIIILRFNESGFSPLPLARSPPSRSARILDDVFNQTLGV